MTRPTLKLFYSFFLWQDFSIIFFFTSSILIARELGFSIPMSENLLLLVRFESISTLKRSQSMAWSEFVMDESVTISISSNSVLICSSTVSICGCAVSICSSSVLLCSSLEKWKSGAASAGVKIDSCPWHQTIWSMPYLERSFRKKMF